MSDGSVPGHHSHVTQSADGLLLSLFERQARELFVQMQHHGVHATASYLAERVVDEAARHLTRVRQDRDYLRFRLEALLTAPPRQ